MQNLFFLSTFAKKQLIKFQKFRSYSMKHDKDMGRLVLRDDWLSHFFRICRTLQKVLNRFYEFYKKILVGDRTD